MAVDVTSLVQSLVVVVVAMLAIKYACDQFEPAADYLGRNMPPGIKGATINAIGSSMPELLTSMAFLFTVAHIDVGEGLLNGIAVTAGSAIFNSVVIPALVILAVTIWGLKNKKPDDPPIEHIEVGQETILRDGFFLLIAEGLLIWFLGYSVLSWGTALVLMASYAAYVAYLVLQHYRGQGENDEDEDDDDDDDEGESSTLVKILTFDFINLVYGGREFTTNMAWGVLGLSILVLAITCHFLAEAVISAANALNIPTYFSAVILAAAATSVPDTVLSVKDARKGKYDDALSNAFGSNIFDITICLGLPLLLHAIFFGPIDLSHLPSMEDQVQTLRIVLFGVTVGVLGMFLYIRKVGMGSALALLALYSAWLAWIGFEAFGG